MILQKHFPLELRRFRLVATLLLALISPPAWAQQAPPAASDPKAGADTGSIRIRTTIEPDGTGSIVASREMSPATLPPEAATLIDQYKKQQEAARQTVVEKLKQMAATADAGGSPDQARAIRRAIADLQSACAAEQPLPDPGTLSEYRGQIGKSYLFEVTGVTAGPIWGSGIYTDDSTLAAAAVHAGVLKPGDKGIVRVTIQPGLAAYEGSAQNGVESESYGPWGGSYTVGPYHAGTASIRAAARWIAVDVGDPNDQVRANLAVGTSYTTEITGSTTGTIWGNGIYTTDGSLSTAAVHCGALRAGEKGTVIVTILPGQDSYEAATRNGVTSQSWGRWSSSFVVQKKDAEKAPVLADPTDQVRSNQPVGTSYTVEITGSTGGSVWGNGIYTTDCSLSTAAVHCGALRAGEKGTVTVTILPGQDSYEGATRNGVTSLPYGPWTSSFVVQKTPSKETQPLLPGGPYPAK